MNPFPADFLIFFLQCPSPHQARGGWPVKECGVEVTSVSFQSLWTNHVNSSEAHFLLCFLPQACFSEEGSLYQLNHHMDVLRELCEELTSQKSQQEVRRALKDYEQKIERLRKCASEIRMTLQPTMGGSLKNKLVLQRNDYTSGKNKMKLLAKSNDRECSVFSFRRHVSSSVLICSFDSSLGRL